MSQEYFYGDKLQRRAEWLRSLPDDVRLATELTDQLAKSLSNNQVALTAELIATCIKNKVWEHIAVYEDGNEAEVVSYHPMDWCREVLKIEPGELMKVVVSPIVDSEVGAAAAIELIHMVKEYEPESYKVLIDRKIPGNWQELLNNRKSGRDKVWLQVYAELDKVCSTPDYRYHGGRMLTVTPETIEKAHRLYAEVGNQQKVADILGVSKRTVQCYLAKDPTKYGEEYHEQHSRPASLPAGKLGGGHRARRKLARLMSHPEECTSMGTTLDKVELAYGELLNGVPAAQCLRIAGLSKPKEPEVRLRMRQSAADQAKRIYDLIKLEGLKALIREAQLIVDQVESTTNNEESR